MDSVVMTTPSSAAKIRARVRSAFSAVCSRPLRKAQKNNSNRQAVAQRVSQQQSGGVLNSTGLPAVTNRHHGGNSRQRSAVTGVNDDPKESVVKHAAKRNTTVTAAVTATKTPNVAAQKSLPVKDITACPPQSKSDVLHRNHITTSGIISEALSIWKPRSPNQPVPPDKIQELFNQMQIYPTKRQVQEMLEASRRCVSSSSSLSRRRSSVSNHILHHSKNSPVNNRSSPVAIRERNEGHVANKTVEKRTLTFAEFCVFAAELRRLDKQPSEEIKNKKNSLDSSSYNGRIARNVQSNHTQIHSGASQTNINVGTDVTDGKFTTSKENGSEEINDRINGDFDCRRENEVFLGGSCNPTTWRTDKAIPALEKLGITYYNPQVSHWTPELIDIEYRAKRCARVMFFVMDDETRSTAGSVEVAQIAAERRSLVLVLRPYRPGQCILNEKLSPQEFLDLSRNQQMLQELVESRGLPVLSTIESALVRTKQLINNEILSTVRTSGINVSQKLLDLKSNFDSADIVGNGYLTVQQCVAVLSKMGISTFNNEVTGVLSDLQLHMNKAINKSNINKCNVSTMTVDFQQFCAVITELEERNSQQNKIDKYNANDFDWINKQVVHRQTSSNNNTVDNNNVNCTEEDIPYNFKHSLKNTNASNVDDSNILRDIYLGGSCMLRTKWRQDIVIPMLETNGISYHLPKLHETLAKAYNTFHYAPVFDNDSTALSMSLGSDKSDINRPEKRIKYDDLTISKDGEEQKYNDHPQTITKANLTINLIDIDRSSSGSSISTVSSLNSPVSNDESLYKDFNETDVLEEFMGPDNGNLYNPLLIENSKVLLFYITNQTRSLAPMTLAAFCIGEGRKVVLCIEMLSDNSAICGEKLTRTAIKDFNRGRAYLADMARREGVPVYEDILLATEKAISMVKD